MKARIKSVKFKADKKLEEFIQEHVDKIMPLFDGIDSCDVMLRLNKDEKKENKIVEMKLGIVGNDIFVKKYAKTFEEAMTSASVAVKKQLMKRKEKIKNL